MSPRTPAKSGGRTAVYARLYPFECRQLQQEAAARRISLSAAVTDCLCEYFALRLEMASAVTVPGKPGERHTGLIHSLLARTEERLAATVDARAAELGDDLRVLRSMVDRLVQLYLVHTPEVVRELRAGAVASANRRYANYRQAVSELVASRGSNGTGIGERPSDGGDDRPRDGGGA